MSHYRELGNPEEVSGRIREPRWLRKVQEVWGLCHALTLALSRLRICSWNAEGVFRAVKSHTHKSNGSVSWGHKAITHTSNTHGSFIPCSLSKCCSAWSHILLRAESNGWAHTEIRTQTTQCPSGPDSYLLIPAESMPDITQSYETACCVIPSISSDMARGEKKARLYKYERFHTLLGDLVERKSGCEQ